MGTRVSAVVIEPVKIADDSVVASREVLPTSSPSEGLAAGRISTVWNDRRGPMPGGIVTVCGRGIARGLFLMLQMALPSDQVSAIPVR